MWRLTFMTGPTMQTVAGEGPVVRGQARDGTTRFLRVITAYVMVNYLRVTLVVRFVLPDEDTVDVIERCAETAKDWRIQIERLFLDKALRALPCKSI